MMGLVAVAFLGQQLAVVMSWDTLVLWIGGWPLGTCSPPLGISYQGYQGHCWAEDVV